MPARPGIREHRIRCLLSRFATARRRRRTRHQIGHPAGRLEARCGSHRCGRRTRHRDGVHRNAPLPPLECQLHEDSDHRRRRPRTRAGLEVRPIAARAAGVRRSGQRGHGARAQGAQCRHRGRRYRRAAEFAAARRHRTHHRRPEGPLVAGIVDRFAAAGRAVSDRRAPRRAWKDRRPSPRNFSSATAFRRQATPPSPPRVSIRPTSERNAYRWSSKRTDSPPARASSSARPMSRPSPRPRHARRQFRRRRPHHRDRGIPATARKSASSWSPSDQSVLPLATSQDHKRRDDGDPGPNTGGMGAYSPAPIVTPALHARIMREVIEPTLRGLARRRQSLHGISVRRIDDRRGRHAQRTGIQLPVRRSRDPADSDAPAKRSGRSVRGGARRLLVRDRGPLGPTRGARCRDGGRRLSRATAKAIPSAVSMPPPDCRARYSTPAPARRAAAIVTAGGRVLCAVGLGDTVAAAQRQAYDWCTPFTGTWCNTAAISAIAPSSARARKGTQSHYPGSKP